MLTKEEFEHGYITRSEMTPEFYHKHLVTMACACGDELCEGWAAISNDPFSIEHHNKFCAPRDGGE